MKFQKLTIHNIASIEDAVIDFEAQPLADSEVFLITGKTGAGKSTILDAICLALFAGTPRLNNTMMQGVTMDAEKEVKINDPRQLMRRNTTEAFVKLTFTGNNDVRYEATWAVARAHKKLSGSVKSKTWELKNLDLGTTYTKDTEIKTEIRVAVGLDFNQFCRTTMLAQGEFTRFLNSKDDDKAEILEKITGVDIYSKIGAKVYELTGKKKQEWDDAMLVAKEIRTLTEEEIDEKNRLIAALEIQLKKLNSQTGKEEAKRDWLRTEAQLSKEHENAKTELQKATEIVESHGFKAKESLVENWKSTIAARQWLTEKEHAILICAEQKNVLDKLKGLFITLLGGQKAAEEENNKITQEINETETFLKQEAANAALYENKQTLVGYLTTICEGRNAIERNNLKIEQEQRILNETLHPALTKATNEVKAEKEALEQKEAELKQQEDEVNALNLPKLRSECDKAKELLLHIKTAKERIDTLVSAREKHETTCKHLTAQQAAIEEKKSRAKQMENPLHDAKQRMDVCKEILDKQKDTIDKFATTLRQKLQKDDICPVCRQKIVSELPHEEELSSLVSELQDTFNKTEKEYNDLNNAKIRLEAEINTESVAHEREEKLFNEDKSVENAKQKAEEACMACHIDSLDNTTPSVLDAMEHCTHSQKNELEGKIKNGETKEVQARNLRLALDLRHRNLESLKNKVQNAEKDVSESKGRIATAEVLVKTKRMEVETAEQKVRSHLVTEKWNTDWLKTPEELGIALTEASSEYQTKLQKNQELSISLESNRTNICNVASVIASIVERMPDWKNIEAVTAIRIGNMLGTANDIENKVIVAQTQLKAAEHTLITNKTRLNAFFAENKSLDLEQVIALHTYAAEDIAQKEAELKKFRDAVVEQRTLAKNSARQLEEHLQKRAELGEEENLPVLNQRIADLENQQNEIVEQKGAVNQELRTDSENKLRVGALLKDAAEKEAVYQKWSRLNQLIGNSTGSTFRKIAQSYVLSSLIHSANSYMKTLTDRYTLKVSPGTFVISIEDAYQGFVSRAASTISGGESFLVSLSLALALSDIGQQWQIDTLFIDEGFGTLSGEPLQKAVETLRSLHSACGRHVGIISHVEELQERIPVQIQVIQEGNNSSSQIRIVP